MRLVLISDTHGLEPRVPDGDVLIHAGDLTMTGTRSQVAAAGAWLQSLPHRHKVVIAGNHDWLFERKPADAVAMLGAGITYLQDSATAIKGVKIYGSPVQPRFFDWAFNVDRGFAIRHYWDAIPADTDILVTHGPPMGVLDQANPALDTEHCGCEELLLAVKRVHPRIHIFGHIHGGYGKHETVFGTVCYNASAVNEAYKLKNAPWVVEL